MVTRTSNRNYKRQFGKLFFLMPIWQSFSHMWKILVWKSSRFFFYPFTPRTDENTPQTIGEILNTHLLHHSWIFLLCVTEVLWEVLRDFTGRFFLNIAFSIMPLLLEKTKGSVYYWWNYMDQRNQVMLYSFCQNNLPQNRLHTLEKLETLSEVLNSQINSIKAKWSPWNIAIRLYKL